MINSWELPTSLCICGEEWEIETEYRKILKILKYFADPDYDDQEKWEICLAGLYKDYDIDSPPPGDVIGEMQKQAVMFIDGGIEDDGRKKPRLMDWWQDAPVMAAPISRIIGHDVRSGQPVHWWTFLGAYMDIGESLFSQIISIRQKRAKRQKLDKQEQQFYRDNKKLIDLHVKLPERGEEEKQELRKLFGY